MKASSEGSCSVGDRPGGGCLCPDLGLLLIRLMLATVFIYHGGGKLFGWFGGPGIVGFTAFLTKLNVSYPQVSAYLSGGTEFIGGIILIVGCGARLAAIPMAFNMAIAVLTVHLHNGFSVIKNGVEYPLTLGVVLLALGLHGPGTVQALRAVSRRMLLLLRREEKARTAAPPSGEAKS